jgi:uncharacterized protein YwqG
VEGQPEVLSRGERKPIADLAPISSPPRHDQSYQPTRLSRTLLERLRASPLQGCLSTLDQLYSPGLAFRAARLTAEPMSTGTSKTGGLPDLVPGSAWPRYKGTPMTFLAQFNLEEVHAANPHGRLPRFGLLSIFRAADAEYGGPMWYDPEARADASMVLFAPDLEELERAALPSHGVSRQAQFITPPCSIAFSAARPFPAIDGLHFSESDLTEEEREAFLALVRSLDFGDENDHRRHQILGYRDSHRWPELEAERMSNGLDQFGAFDANSDVGKALIRAAAGWIPLLELSSCDVANWMWGDGGALKWLIRATDLDVMRFDRAVAVSAR